MARCKGGYIARKETGALTTILLATGSELQHAMAAAEELGDGVRVVSLPCFERFDRQSADYRESVLPAACTKRIAIEAGVTGLWWKYRRHRGQGPRHRPLRHQRPRRHRDARNSA